MITWLAALALFGAGAVTGASLVALILLRVSIRARQQRAWHARQCATRWQVARPDLGHANIPGMPGLSDLPGPAARFVARGDMGDGDE
jgi:hypothetical protein